MASRLPIELPPCGLYLTTKPLPGREEEVQAGQLVTFHNHSEDGHPVVVLADHNVHNRWHFHGNGVPFRARSWAATLRKIPEQGLYVLRKEFRFEGGRWPRRTLVQLAYSRRADPMIFLAQLPEHADHNAVYFASRGVPMALDKLSMLDGPLWVHSERES